MVLQKKYGVHILVYYEMFTSMRPAILREKHMKEWHRPWKVIVIETANPTWRDLFNDITEQ